MPQLLKRPSAPGAVAKPAAAVASPSTYKGKISKAKELNKAAKALAASPAASKSLKKAVEDDDNDQLSPPGSPRDENDPPEDHDNMDRDGADDDAAADDDADSAAKTPRKKAGKKAAEDADDGDENDNGNAEKTKKTPASKPKKPEAKKATPAKKPDASSSKPDPVLKGVIAHVNVTMDDGDIDSSATIEALLKEMGATVRKSMTVDITHLVFRNGKKATFDKAKSSAGVHIVSVLWVQRCKEAGKLITDYEEFAVTCDADDGKKRRKSMEPKEVKEVNLDDKKFSSADDKVQAEDAADGGKDMETEETRSDETKKTDKSATAPKTVAKTPLKRPVGLKVSSAMKPSGDSKVKDAPATSTSGAAKAKMPKSKAKTSDDSKTAGSKDAADKKSAKDRKKAPAKRRRKSNDDDEEEDDDDENEPTPNFDEDDDDDDDDDDEDDEDEFEDEEDDYVTTKKPTTPRPDGKKRVILKNFVVTNSDESLWDIACSATEALGKFEISAEINRHTLFVVTGLKNLEKPRRTLTLLHGVSRKLPVVTADWLCSSLEQGAWQDCDKFEVSGIPPKKDRASPLAGVKCAVGHFDAPLADVTALIHQSGGQIVSLSQSPDVVIGHSRRLATPIPSVSEKWLFDCIWQNEKLPLETYFLPNVDASASKEMDLAHAGDAAKDNKEAKGAKEGNEGKDGRESKETEKTPAKRRGPKSAAAASDKTTTEAPTSASTNADAEKSNDMETDAPAPKAAAAGKRKKAEKTGDKTDKTEKQAEKRRKSEEPEAPPQSDEASANATAAETAGADGADAGTSADAESSKMEVDVSSS